MTHTVENHLSDGALATFGLTRGFIIDGLRQALQRAVMILAFSRHSPKRLGGSNPTFRKAEALIFFARLVTLGRRAGLLRHRNQRHILAGDCGRGFNDLCLHRRTGLIPLPQCYHRDRQRHRGRDAHATNERGHCPTPRCR